MNRLGSWFMLVLLTSGFGAADLKAQATTPEPCRIGQQAPPIGFWTWPAGVRVKFYIRSADFSDEQSQYLLTAVQNWNVVLEKTDSGVQFEYQGKTTSELSCELCLTIMRGAVFNYTTRHATELKAYSKRGDQLISHASILVDPILTNDKALLNALAHEIGHNLGLLDCYSCKRKSTVMNQFAVINKPNGMEAPSPCDIAQVRKAYLELKTRVRPSPTSLGEIDDGEEPVDDDTPVVVRRPWR